MSVRLSSRLAAALIVPALLVVACGGGATGSTSPNGSGTASEPSTGGALPSDLAFPSDLAIPSFDLGSLVQNLENVDSYKIVIDATGDTYTGTVITRPVLSRDLYMGTGAGATHIVSIGDESWIGTGDGPVQPAPSALVASMLPLFDPMVLVAAFANQSVAEYAEDLGTEDKNGQPTTHYKVNPALMMGGLMSFPPTASIEMWVAADGYLVSYAATDFGSVGANLAIDVTNVNDPANEVPHP